MKFLSIIYTLIALISQKFNIFVSAHEWRFAQKCHVPDDKNNVIAGSGQKSL